MTKIQEPDGSRAASPKAGRKRLYQSPENDSITVESVEVEVMQQEGDSAGAVVKTEQGDRMQRASGLINKHILWSMAGGLIPVPFIDSVVISSIQVKLIHGISGIYGVSFERDRIKAVVAALIGGLGATVTAEFVAGRALKRIPGIGSFLSVMISPVLAGASTYAIGKVFVKHYETGGTFISFDPLEVQEYFAKQFKEGLLFTETLIKKKQA